MFLEPLSSIFQIHMFINNEQSDYSKVATCEHKVSNWPMYMLPPTPTPIFQECRNWFPHAHCVLILSLPFSTYTRRCSIHSSPYSGFWHVAQSKYIGESGCIEENRQIYKDYYQYTKICTNFNLISSI